jgi:histone acetyltransferase 1
MVNIHLFNSYEKYSAPEDGSARYAIAGYATMYQYYAYPDKVRPRISQVRMPF